MLQRLLKTPSSLTGNDAQTAWPLGLALLIGIVCGTCLRFIGLEHLPIWHDEVFSLMRVFGFDQANVHAAIFSGQLFEPAELLRFQVPSAEHGWADTLDALLSHPEHTPLYYLLARLAGMLPAEPIVALRALAATFGVLLIPAVYWLMRELFGRGIGAWIGAALVACSPLQLLYAQEARQYSLWLLIVALSSAALCRALRLGRHGDWALYAMLLAIGCYSHLLFALMLPVHGLFALIEAFGREELHGARMTTRIREMRGVFVNWLLAAAVAVAAFSPWIWVLLDRHERVVNFTAWMQRPMDIWELLFSWTRHVVRTFVDFSDTPHLWWGIVLGGSVWALLRFVHRAPRPAVLLLPLVALIYVGATLGPDLLLGGSRSGHVRYILPALLAVELMVAWVLADALQGTLQDQGHNSRRRSVALAALALLLTLGLISQLRILQAPTWSTKHYSAGNAELAGRINAGPAPLVMAGNSGVATGELISLAHHLAPHARLWAAPPTGKVAIPQGFAPLLLLTPDGRLIDALGSKRRLKPVAGTWQWFFAIAPGTRNAAMPPGRAHEP